MKIDEAIKILSTYMKGSDEAEPVKFDDAILLGIEALKRIVEAREQHLRLGVHLLPGETE